MLTLLTLLALGVVTAKLANRFVILVVDMMATAIAVWLYLQSYKVARRVVAARQSGRAVDVDTAWTNDRAQRHLMARHLRHALNLTELSSLFPKSCSRGHSIARGMTNGAA
jgi:hypothetical protein